MPNQVKKIIFFLRNGNVCNMKISKLQDGGTFVEQEDSEKITNSDDLVAKISQASMQILLGRWEGAVSLHADRD